MPGQISRKKIEEGILEGIIKAQEDYRKWSYDDWLFLAPEYLLTVYIAQQIMQIKGAKYVTLENSAKSAMNYAGAMGKGRLHSDIRKDGRFDLVLWWGDVSPRSVIEVKNRDASFGDTIKKDILRISKVLDRNKRNSTFRSGFMAFYISCHADKKESCSAEEKIKNRIRDFHEKACCLLEDKKIELRRRIYVEHTDAWAAVVLTITRKNK